MLRRNVSSKLTRLFGVVAAVSGVSVVAVGALLKLDPTKYDHNVIFQVSLSLVQDSAWWLIPVLAIIAGVSQRMKQGLGTVGTWRLVDHLLTQYREALLGKRPAKEDPEHFHRITLFRHVRWRWSLDRWPWSGWMVPIARTGHTTKGKIPRFRANANRPDAAEGIAGQAWAQNRTIAVNGLYEINPETPAQELEAYANHTFVSTEWLAGRRDRNHGRSFLGVPLEVNGVPWGALVVDSRSDAPISSKSALNNIRYKILTEMLSKLLQQ